jgi:hypothetical protein
MRIQVLRHLNKEPALDKWTGITEFFGLAGQFHYLIFFLRMRAAEFMQYRFPVGAGPSSKT